MERKIAITGITGKNGQVLFQYLLQNQVDVLERWNAIKLLVRNPQGAMNISESASILPIEIVEGDLENEGVAERLLDGCDTVLHIAGIQKSLSVVKAAIVSKTKRVILVHTTGIYSKFKSAGENYRQIETEIRKLAEEHHLIMTILRPTMIYGSMKDHNISVFIDMVYRMKMIPVINGAHYELQPVNCRDLGKAFYQVLMNPEICDGKEYILSGDRPVELRELLTIIRDELGMKKGFLSCPFPIAYLGAWGLYICTGRKKDFREKVQRMCESRAYSHQKATDDFGYCPMRIEDGLKEEIKLYLKTGLMK